MKDFPLDSTDLTWLTGLARALLGDAHGADDLVQDTVVAALERPLPDDAPRRAWLASVARRLVARRYRGDTRRTRREKKAAREELLPDSAELVQRAEVAERVTAAARALPEPFRRTILLRFLEGLSPEEIARREGKPTDTVRWRVRRGLQLLREELVRSDGRDWSSWSVLLVPLARNRGEVGVATAGASGAVAGSVALWTVMNTKLIALTVATLGGVGLWITTTSTPRAETESASSRVLSSAKEERMEEDRTESSPVITRVDRGDLSKAESGASTDAITVPLDPLPPGILGRVTDPQGKAIPGATAYLVVSAGAVRTEGDPTVLIRTESDESGKFHLAQEQWEAVEGATGVPLDLGVTANGFLRGWVRDVLRRPPDQELVVVLDRGRMISGRVIDPAGRGVPGLELLAYAADSRLDHVSPSQVLLRGQRAQLGDTSSRHFQSLARTNDKGEVVFRGLGRGEILVQSLDPGWTMVSPNQVEADQNLVLWNALPQLGVRLWAVDASTGQPLERANATFRVEITDDTGEVSEHGQWVGRGQGMVSFVLDPGFLFASNERTITQATFYGTLGSGNAEVSWRAKTLGDPSGVTGVADVRVEIDPSIEVEPPAEIAPPVQDEVPIAFLELDVRYTDETPFAGRLVVDWLAEPKEGPALEGTERLQPMSPGRYRMEVPAGQVSLSIHEGNYQGSLPARTARLFCEPNCTVSESVRLPVGATAVILRPATWRGDWWLHASFRAKGEEEWRGSWNYGTSEETLTLAALEAAEWRFRLRRTPDFDPAKWGSDVVEYVVSLSGPGQTIVGE